MSAATPPPGGPGAGAAHGTGAGSDRPRQRRPVLAGVALVAVGTVWLLRIAGIDVAWTRLVPWALVVVGALVLWRGRRGEGEVGGLVAVGVALAIVGVLTTLVPSLPDRPSPVVGDRTVDPSSVAEFEDGYALGVGTMTIDLSDVVLPRGTTTLTAAVAVGELTVIVPEGVVVRGHVGAGLGDVDALGRTRSGIAPTVEVDEGAGPVVLEVDLTVGLGEVEVRR